MKYVLCVGLLVGMYSCVDKMPKTEYKLKIGSLYFDTYDISWGNVFLGEEKTRMIRVYNPTDSTINLKGVVEHHDFKISSRNCYLNEWLDKGVYIQAKSCDTIYFIFSTADTNNLGIYHEEIRFKIDEHEQYQHFILRANVQERLDAVIGQNEVPIVEVDSVEHDFGEMHEGQKKVTFFGLRNKGTKPLIIRKIETTCGCTVATSEKRVINPDQSTVLEVGFRAWGKSGKQRKTITMYCNDPRQPVVTFTIQCLIQN